MKIRELIVEKLSRLNEAKFDTIGKKKAHLKKSGNIITFKKPFEIQNGEKGDLKMSMFKKHPNEVLKRKQIIISGLVIGKGGYQLEGVTFDTPWYKSLDDLIDAVDWEFMEGTWD